MGFAPRRIQRRRQQNTGFDSDEEEMRDWAYTSGLRASRSRYGDYRRMPGYTPEPSPAQSTAVTVWQPSRNKVHEVVVGGEYERWVRDDSGRYVLTQQPFQLRLLQDLNTCVIVKADVRYVNFVDFDTDWHGSWYYDDLDEELVLKFHHWGNPNLLRRAHLKRQRIDEMEGKFWPHVCFEGFDYLGRDIWLRLHRWTGTINPGDFSQQYWKTNLTKVLEILTRNTDQPKENLMQALDLVIYRGRLLRLAFSFCILR